MQRMTRLDYRLGFTTPAFLGGADQAAQWRTPPFKALLRQWWRVLNAREHRFDYASLREREGLLFGNAWLEGTGQRSRHRKSEVWVRLLPEWSRGDLQPAAWPKGFGSVTTTAGGRGVPADLYLGYGPLQPPGQERRSAISLEQTAELSVLAPACHELALRDTVALGAWFGTVGSRSRNAWGSLAIEPVCSVDALPRLEADVPLLQAVSRPWKECLEKDWPHAIGIDERGLPLIWHTEPLDDWRQVIRKLAEVRVAVRRKAKEFRNGRVGGIHLLGYPAGRDWTLQEARTARLANSLRMKVVRAERDTVRGQIVHMPCKPPAGFLGALREDARGWLESSDNQRNVWTAVHATLCRDRDLTQLGAEA